MCRQCSCPLLLLVLLMVPASLHLRLLSAACQHQQQQLSLPAPAGLHSQQHAGAHGLPAGLALCWLGHCSCGAGQHQLQQLAEALPQLPPLLLLLRCRLQQQRRPQQQHPRCRCAPPADQQLTAYSMHHQQLLLEGQQQQKAMGLGLGLLLLAALSLPLLHHLCQPPLALRRAGAGCRCAAPAAQL